MINHISKFARKSFVTGGTTLLLLMAGAAGCASGDDNGQPPADPTAPTVVTGAPPPIIGGTLLITHDDSIAVAADPDRDAVWLIDLVKRNVRARVSTSPGAEPGRVVEDADGLVHVALRRAGSVLKLDPQTGTVVSNRTVCPAPRGLAYDKATDNLHVACAGGELVTLKARGGDAVRTLILDRDLRDVVVKSDHLLVSRFRSAELLDLNAGGTVINRLKPRQLGSGVDKLGLPNTASPTAAWRLLSLPGDEVLMLHQRAGDMTISTMPGGYGGGGPPNCPGNSIVSPALTTYRGTTTSGTLVGDGMTPPLALAVDAAVSPDGTRIAIVGPSDPTVKGALPLTVYFRSTLTPNDPCGPQPNIVPLMDATFTAAAYNSAGMLYVQSREPAELVIPDTSQIIRFTGSESRADSGHKLFHTPTQGLIACASCHPEGGDDSHVWNFQGVGPRRTQSLRGGLLSTAPFHWDGDQTDLTMLMQTVFSGRMSGPTIDKYQVYAVGFWLDSQAKLPASAPRDAAAVSRGDALFHDAVVGCATCHSGPHFTSNQTVDVGTGKALQVPTLLDVGTRAPYIHTGCAKTLRDRFDPTCGGGDNHGKTSQLSTNQIDDLVAYLETL